MDERMRFVIAANEDGSVMTELCERFGISRTIGYKWLERYQAEGIDGLKDRSRAPLQHGLAHPRIWSRRYWRCASVIRTGDRRSCG